MWMIGAGDLETRGPAEADRDQQKNRIKRKVEMGFHGAIEERLGGARSLELRGEEQLI